MENITIKKYNLWFSLREGFKSSKSKFFLVFIILLNFPNKSNSKESDFNIITYDEISPESFRIDELLAGEIYHESSGMFKIDNIRIISLSIIQNQKSNQQKNLHGVVKDKGGVPIGGVTITVKGTTRGVMTDMDGSFSLDVKLGDKLVFSFIGFQSQEITYTGQKELNVVLEEKTEALEGVTLVAFSKQKKESVIASISTVNPSELRVPSSNLTTALAGRVPGLISYQRSGEPGQDDASFFVRGVTSFSYAKGPLILIDGVEMSSSDLARLQPDDIASFSIMKDAAATALYGARGGNGVILVTTKEGREGKAKISFRYETSFSQPTTNIDLADPINYMKLNNEAVLTRNPLSTTPYSLKKIENTEKGNNPLIYPATDWYDMLFKKSTTNHRANFNVSGGGKVARYYIAGTYNQDSGMLKVDNQNNFNNNIDLKKYLLRSNVNINVTPTTEAVVRLQGTFDDYTGPIDGGAKMYQRVMYTDPVLFPPYYPKTEDTKNIQHVLFGNYDKGQYMNPYAEMVKGYKNYTKSKMFAQFELKQDLDFLAKGLKMRGLFNTKRYSFFDVKRYYKPFYYDVAGYNEQDGSYQLHNLNPTEGTEYLNYKEGTKSVAKTSYAEVAVNYDKTFGEKHAISGLLVGTMRNHLSANAGSLSLSLPSRNIGLAGRFTYAFDSRYFSEFNFGYNGSERFAKDERFGFFPSFGVGYILSNEAFWKGKVSKIISKLKLKATYGLVGNSAIGSASDRFFYLSEVSMNSGAKGYQFGQDFGYSLNGVSVSRYANNQITWEVARKTNLGAEIDLFKKWEIAIDVYHEYRESILMSRANIPSTMGLQATPQSNVGEASSHGIDFSIDYNESFLNGLWLTARANFTYATAKYKVYENVFSKNTPWLNRVDQKVGQQWGYVAERLFVDQAEVDSSPEQSFSQYTGGDIKYRDIDNDGIISPEDKVPIGYPTRPEIIYGFGVSSGFKNFDLSFFFQGLARESFWIDPVNTSPFADTDGQASVISKNALLQAYANDHWTEDNRNLYALWPRLSDKVMENNTQKSTWFMRDGSFLRLKSVEFGYSVPKKLIETYKLENLRFYASGTNLLTFSKFDLWDPEMAGNGLGYPVQKVFNVGLQLSF